MRKTEGTEGKGLCLLIIYAVLLFLVILVEVVVGSLFSCALGQLRSVYRENRGQ